MWRVRSVALHKCMYSCTAHSNEFSHQSFDSSHQDIPWAWYVMQTVPISGVRQMSSLKAVHIKINYSDSQHSENKDGTRPQTKGRGSRVGSSSFITDMLAALKPMRELDILELEDVLSTVQISRCEFCCTCFYNFCSLLLIACCLCILHW